MLTRLKVDGFKNLMGVDVAFGPFTCVAGVNGVGKSNLFDAIRFLSALADKPLIEAALSVRSEGARSADLRSIFHRGGGRQFHEMSFEAEMLVPPHGVDDLGQEARAAVTFLCYRLTLRLTDAGLAIVHEELSPIPFKKARAYLRFPHKLAWRKSVSQGEGNDPFISTEEISGQTYVKLRRDLGSAANGDGWPRRYLAEKLPRTLLSDANASESPTAVLARREMQSWRLLQLEPSALRTPDPFTAPTSMAADGSHLPATLARLAGVRGPRPEAGAGKGGSIPDAATVYARVANRLAELLSGVRSVRVDIDERRELLTLMLTETTKTEHEARALSDGTLRFLALAILENDPTTRGVLCLEEPENGIHPSRIPVMLRLLSDLAVDTDQAVDSDNPLRQVIINTHSPAAVAELAQEDLLVAVPVCSFVGGVAATGVTFRWLESTWRSQLDPNTRAVALGEVLSFLRPVTPCASDSSPTEPEAETAPRGGRRRVIDRDDLQPWLPHFASR